MKMPQSPNYLKTTCLQVFLTVLLSLPAFASVPVLNEIAVNIYGDGDAGNGTEDSRKQIEVITDKRLAAGTVYCDGKNRGTAMVLDTREFAPSLKGVVLVSAAHVLFDLKTGKRFKRCEFRFLGLKKSSKYRAKLKLNLIQMGDFDPHADPGGSNYGEGDWVFMYAPKAWRDYDPNTALTLGEFSFSHLDSYRHSNVEFKLIAFDANSGQIKVSRDCTVVKSQSGDIGGGRWAGQLLDDCDSQGGASGGGIVAVWAEKKGLVGIRGGSHWSDEKFPDHQFPGGPPDGAVWSPESNTNFARAIDAKIMQVLQEFTQVIELKEGTF